jgi:hypothetical protein
VHLSFSSVVFLCTELTFREEFGKQISAAVERGSLLLRIWNVMCSDLVVLAKFYPAQVNDRIPFQMIKDRCFLQPFKFMVVLFILPYDGV